MLRIPKKNLNHLEKYAISTRVAIKMNHMTRRMPDRGWREIAEAFDRTEQTIRNVWKQYLEDQRQGKSAEETLRPKKKARKDHPSQFDVDTQIAIDQAILAKDGNITYREIKLAVEEDGVMVALSQIYNYCTMMGITEESQYIKPKLTDHHRMLRKLFVLNRIDPSNPQDLRYYSHENTVSIDEKNFKTDPLRKTIKYLPDHPRHPHNTTQHKSYIPHLTITAGFSQPTEDFDGKCALTCHGDYIPAQRSSARRPAGTIELHPKTVDGDEFWDSQTKVHPDLAKTGVLDQIVRRKQPDNFTKIQMDNAPPHVGNDMKERLNQFCDDNSIMTSYHTQPSQSPDFNICDLALFNSLQKRTDRLKAEGEESLVVLWEVVQRVFIEYEKETIQVCYGHLYANYNECLAHDGDNRYKNPHEKVRAKFRRGEPLNKCKLDFETYHRMRAEVLLYFETHPVG